MEVAETTTRLKRKREEYCQSHHDNSSTFEDTFLDDDDQHHDHVASAKRHYNILNLLEDDNGEQEPSDEDLSAIFTTLERELSSPSSPSDYHQRQPLASIITTEISDLSQVEYCQDTETANDGSVATSAEEGDENVKSVMRHLLEASDDELGIPNSNNNDEINDEDINISSDDRSGENMAPFGFNDGHGFWEMEDEAANYYTELHSELFYAGE